MFVPLAFAACASLGGLEGGETDGGRDTGRTAVDAARQDATGPKPDSGAPKNVRDASIPVSDSGADSGFGFTVSAPPSLTLQQGASAPVTVTVTRFGGFADAISFTVSGLPAAATFNPLTITNGSSSGELTLVVGDATPQSVSHLAINGIAAGGSISASANMDLVVRGPPGSLDTLFGNQGVVSGFLTTTNFGTLAGAVLDANGNVVLAIDTEIGGGPISVVRILPSGTLDSNFGTSGIATVPDTGTVGFALFSLPTGELELSCLSQHGSPWTDELIRLKTNGSIDSSFSPDGGIGNSIVRTDGQPYTYTLDDSSRVVETGFTGNAAGFLLTRRTAAGPHDGTFDATFTSTIPGPGGPTVIQPDGHIVASYASTTAPYAMGLVRTDSAGNLDSTFGTGGVVPATGPGNPYGLLIQSSGKLVAGGVTFSNAGNELPGGFIARYLANGTLDITFGSGGVATVTPGNVFAIAQQSDEEVVAVGYPSPATDAGAPTNDIWVERVTAGGLPDTTFGQAGVVTTPIGGAGEISEGEFVAVQPDGRIVVVVATYKSYSVYDFAVVRYWP